MLYVLSDNAFVWPPAGAEESSSSYCFRSAAATDADGGGRRPVISVGEAVYT